MINGRLATVCPPSSVLLVASLLLSLSLFLSLLFSPSLSLSFPTVFITLFPCFPYSAGYSMCPCMRIHARHACRYSHAHTPFCLYLIIGSITGDIFPDNASEGGEPGRQNERGRSLYPSSHGSHSTGTPTD